MIKCNRYATPKHERRHVVPNDNVREKGGGERYPTLRGKPETKNIRDMDGGDWYRSKVRRVGGKTGEGFGGSAEKATDEAYKKAGGTVDTSRKHPF